ncbi:hypothetical protein [Deinococcus ruber]|uniref:Uncharacterized protein n=1 Tax=Deinococcus ruber TaxID=1848197 RepID=A0A918C6W4_9DEIO|nr:hypothetical protein [Deinococcus ruber]GGR09714.1 hypothetical protein GCM10008957_23080 [Deinococcus ruber]
MKRAAVVMLSLTVSMASATDVGPAEIARSVAQASREIVAYLPYAEQPDVADALRLAALRGKRVYLITSVRGVQDPLGFTLRLAHVPGVRSYLAVDTGQPFVIIDGQAAYSGNGLMQDGIGTRITTVLPNTLLAWAQAVTAHPAVAKLDLLKLRYQIKR